MAITATHYRLFKSLPLPQGGSLLEIGEANWYGDLEPDFPCDLKGDLHDIAKAFYDATFAPSRLMAIDWNGTPSALRVDLNDGHATAEAVRDGDFDVVINHGTAEHIFNIAQVFRTMHDACADGGLMVHDAPFTGWIDHGFYCLQPTLFYDLAAANNYEVVKVAIHTIEGQQIIPIEGRERWSPISNGDQHAVIRSPKAGHLPPAMSQLLKECNDWVKAWCPSWEMAEEIAKDHNAKSAIPDNSMLFVALRKYGDSPFKIPAQGYYAGKLSDAGMRAWEDLR
jgi:SAM-dependent methyltransferase